MGFGVFQLDINKWDQWKENSKYLIPYDDSDLTMMAERDSQMAQRTLKKALETIESVSSLKFVKYDTNNCLSGDPCSWYIKFIRTTGPFSSKLGRNKKSGPHLIKLNSRGVLETKYHFYIIHEVRSIVGLCHLPGLGHVVF